MQLPSQAINQPVQCTGVLWVEDAARLLDEVCRTEAVPIGSIPHPGSSLGAIIALVVGWVW